MTQILIKMDQYILKGGHELQNKKILHMVTSISMCFDSKVNVMTLVYSIKTSQPRSKIQKKCERLSHSQIP